MQNNSLEPLQTPGGWDEVGPEYADLATISTGKYAEDALRLVGLRDNERFLDVAAGSGALSFAAAKMGAEVMATDFSPVMIEHLLSTKVANGVANITAEVMDGQALHLADNDFDVACSMFGLFLFPDRAKGFTELLRVLKPGGRGAVLSWSENQTLAFNRRVLQSIAPDKTETVMDALQDPEVFKREMTEAGFRDVQIHTVMHQNVGDTPMTFWEQCGSKFPNFARLAKTADAEQLKVIRDTYVNLLRDQFGDGPVAFDTGAHIGVGIK